MDARTNAIADPKNSRVHDCVVRKAAYYILVRYRYRHDSAQPVVDGTVQANSQLGMNPEDVDDMFMYIHSASKIFALLCFPKSINVIFVNEYS
jgi:hypothetical protein